MRINKTTLFRTVLPKTVALKKTASKTMLIRSVYLIPMFSMLLAACSDTSSNGLSLGEERSTSNEAKITEQMIAMIKETSVARHAAERSKPMARFNQSKSLGCFDATFSINDNLPTELAQGVFSSHTSYPAKVRFANASQFDDREKDFRGMSISIFNVQQDTLWGEPGQQDFLLNSYPILFAKDGRDFLEFIEASRDDKLWQYFIRPSHFYSLKTALIGREKINNPLAIQYWSTTPFRHGSDKSTAVKYSVKPCANDADKVEDYKTTQNSANFLSTAMTTQLNQAPACLDFMVQFQKDPQTMPIENAAIRWNEDQSPFQSVAKIIINQQDFNNPKQQIACEDMRFNPWQSLPAHRPLGDVNRLRKAVYYEMGAFRSNQNNQRK